MPSTRTPEGDEVHCPVCDHISVVDHCYPIGDTICSYCGSYLSGELVVDTLNILEDRQRVASLLEACQEFVFGLSTQAVEGRDLEFYGLRILLELFHIYGRVDGVVLWSKQKPRWWFTRVRKKTVSVLGNQYPSGVAERAMKSTQVVSEYKEHGGRLALHIGMPLTWNEEVVAVIEVCDLGPELELSEPIWNRISRLIADSMLQLQVNN